MDPRKAINAQKNCPEHLYITKQTNRMENIYFLDAIASPSSTMSPVQTKLFNPSISYQCTVLNNDDAKRLSLLLSYLPAVALVPSFKLILNYGISIEDTKQSQSKSMSF